MVGLLTLLCLLGAASATIESPRRELQQIFQPQVVGGVNAPSGRYPWMVSLRDASTSSHFCGGMLISDRHVLTASHCFVGYYGERSPSYFLADPSVAGADSWRPTARIGAYGPNDVQGVDYELRSVVGVVTQPEFQWDTGLPDANNKDFCVLLLDAPVTNKALIQLPAFRAKPARSRSTAAATGTSLANATMLRVIGWGIADPITFDTFTGPLQTADVQLQPLATCSQFYSDPIDWPIPYDFTNSANEMICAGTGPDFLKDTCNGDSGGPLFRVGASAAQDMLVGITSWGNGMCQGAPGVYANVFQGRRFIDRAVSFLRQTRWTASSDGRRMTGFDGARLALPGANEEQVIYHQHSLETTLWLFPTSGPWGNNRATITALTDLEFSFVVGGNQYSLNVIIQDGVPGAPLLVEWTDYSAGVSATPSPVAVGQTITALNGGTVAHTAALVKKKEACSTRTVTATFPEGSLRVQREWTGSAYRPWLIFEWTYTKLPDFPLTGSLAATLLTASRGA